MARMGHVRAWPFPLVSGVTALGRSTGVVGVDDLGLGSIMNINRARPLLAFALVTLICAVVIVEGLRANAINVVVRGAPPTPFSGLSASSAVLGTVLAARDAETPGSVTGGSTSGPGAEATGDRPDGTAGVAGTENEPGATPTASSDGSLGSVVGLYGSATWTLLLPQSSTPGATTALAGSTPGSNGSTPGTSKGTGDAARGDDGSGKGRGGGKESDAARPGEKDSTKGRGNDDRSGNGSGKGKQPGKKPAESDSGKGNGKSDGKSEHGKSGDSSGSNGNGHGKKDKS